MDPSSSSSTPYPNQHFFTLPNPNSFSYSLPQNAPSNPIPPPPPPPPILELSTTISALKTLIHLSQNPNLPRLNPQKASHIPCPFNPHHLMPPDSLFRHSLTCPCAPFPPLDSDSLLQSLNYTKTLDSSDDSQKPHRFFQSLHDPNAELCFSLEDYTDFGSNFFYKDCHGVVNLSDRDSSTKRTFFLPSILSVECANFLPICGDREVKGSSKECSRILPSEFWAIQSEIEAWSDYPSVCSTGVVRVILGLEIVRGCDLKNWVIANSPRYGVLIDLYIRDHIIVLLRLCLKAIVTEAICLREREFSIKGSEGMRLECPILGRILIWFTSQLSVLYGEANAKFFAIDMFKHCLLDAAMVLLLFPLDQKVAETCTKKQSSQILDTNENEIRNSKIEEKLESEEPGLNDNMVGESVNSLVISVSQVAAAVAALHERSLLEDKIKGLRISQQLAKYQLVAEHAYVSKKAEEERKKRPNYRPIIEHDGLPQQQSCNQEAGKTKTREELLAEERDYKRRRMSYRGKKLKRTTLQVTRDIIEEYMEEIKQAGGIGCFVKGAGQFPSEPSPAHDISMDVDELRKSNYDLSEATCASPNHSRKQLHPDYNIRSTSFEYSYNDYEQSRRGLHGHHERLDGQRKGIDGDKHDRDYNFRRREKYSDYGQSHKQSSYRRERDNVELSTTKHREGRQLSSIMSNNRDRRSSSSLSDIAGRKNDQKNEVKYKRQRNGNENHSSDFLLQNAFEDRYDPSESLDIYDDDVSTRSKYVRGDKLYVEELYEQPSGHSSKGQYPADHKKS